MQQFHGEVLIFLNLKNNRKYPIKIEAKAGEGVVTVSTYEIKQEDDYTIINESQVTSIIPRPEEHKTLGNPRNE